MQIVIAERLKPYIHLAGKVVVLPLSSLRLRLFPGRVEVEDLSVSPPKKISAITLKLDRPLDTFTVQQDLEKGDVCVWGKCGNQHLRYRISSLDSQAISLSFEKLPSEIVTLDYDESSTCHHVKKGETITIGQPLSEGRSELPLIDRLSLGNHKSQDWELIKRRGDFKEIFPIWHRLGQLTGRPVAEVNGGVASLLEKCEEAVASRKPELIIPAFNILYQAGFEGMLSPRLVDTDWQGIAVPPIVYSSDTSPLFLLQRGAALIRSLFVQEHGSTIHILPALPPEFSCGRLLNVQCEKGLLTIEWTKKSIRRISFHAFVSGKQCFSFSSHEKSFRLRTNNSDKGVRCHVADCVNLESGKNYWFDNFER